MMGTQGDVSGQTTKDRRGAAPDDDGGRPPAAPTSSPHSRNCRAGPTGRCNGTPTTSRPELPLNGLSARFKPRSSWNKALRSLGLASAEVAVGRKICLYWSLVGGYLAGLC